jgi:hypothetical protein
VCRHVPERIPNGMTRLVNTRSNATDLIWCVDWHNRRQPYTLALLAPEIVAFLVANPQYNIFGGNVGKVRTRLAFGLAFTQCVSNRAILSRSTTELSRTASLGGTTHRQSRTCYACYTSSRPIPRRRVWTGFCRRRLDRCVCSFPYLIHFWIPNLVWA